MAFDNTDKQQITKYFYWLAAVAALVLIIFGVSGAFVPEQDTTYTESTETTIAQPADRGTNVGQSE